MRLLLRVVVCARLGCNLVQFVSDRLGDNSTTLATPSPHIPLEIHKHKDLPNQLEKCKSANTENHVDNLPDVNLALLPPNGFACFYAVGNLSGAAGALTGKILDNNSIIWNYFPATPSNLHFSAHFLAATEVTMHNEGRIFHFFLHNFFVVTG